MGYIPVTIKDLYRRTYSKPAAFIDDDPTKHPVQVSGMVHGDYGVLLVDHVLWVRHTLVHVRVNRGVCPALQGPRYHCMEKIISLSLSCFSLHPPSFSSLSLLSFSSSFSLHPPFLFTLPLSL